MSRCTTASLFISWNTRETALLSYCIPAGRYDLHSKLTLTVLLAITIICAKAKVLFFKARKVWPIILQQRQDPWDMLFGREFLKIHSLYLAACKTYSWHCVGSYHMASSKHEGCGIILWMGILWMPVHVLCWGSHHVKWSAWGGQECSHPCHSENCKT